MAVVGKFQLAGHKELMKALSELPLKIEKKVLRKALRSAAKPIQKQAKANAPVGAIDTPTQDLVARAVKLGLALGATSKQISRAKERILKHEANETKKTGAHYPGMLRDSIKVRAMKSRKGQVGVVVQTKDGDFRGETFYGAFVEYGTNKMAAQPFLRPAFDTKKDESQLILASELRTGIAKETAIIVANGQR